jgi:transcriptional regulator with XRE-family HTH domain
MKTRIKEFRAKYDLTQEQLAKKVDVRAGKIQSFPGTGPQGCKSIKNNNRGIV